MHARGAQAGIFRAGNQWLLDANDNYQYDGPPQDLFYINFIAPAPGDIPVAGDWNGTAISKIGIYRPSTGQWFLDYNGDGVFDAGDKVYNFGGIAGDIPVVGDWTGNGVAKVGVVRPFTPGGVPAFWILDANNNHIIDAGDLFFAYGVSRATSR